MVAGKFVFALVVAAAGAGGLGVEGARGAVPQDLETKQTALGQLTGGLAMAISPDSAHMAYVTHAGALTAADRENLKGGQGAGAGPAVRLIVDGKPGVAAQKITTPVYSADSQHLAYARMVHGKWEVVADDRVVAGDGDNVPGWQGRGEPVVFSPDSKHVATVVEKAYRWHVAVDGKEWPVIVAPECGQLSFSPDSKHVAVVTKTRESQSFYVDGVKLPPPVEAGAAKGRELERIFPYYSWRPDGKGIAYAGAFPGKRWQVFVVPVEGGKEGEKSGGMAWQSGQVDGILPGTPVYAFDSSRMAYVAKEKGKWRVCTEAGESPEGFSAVDGPALTFVGAPAAAGGRAGEGPGKARLIYITKSAANGAGHEGGEWNVYIDHKPIGPGYVAFLKETFVVSPDHEHWAAAAVKENGRGGEVVLIRDGKEVGTYDIASPGTFAFSPDSQHLACGVNVNHRWHVWVDGQVGSADFFALHEMPIAFSPDSKQVAYTAELNQGAAGSVGRVYVGADAAYQSKFYQSFLKGAGVKWKDEKSLVTLGITRMIAYRVEMRVPGR